MDAQGDLAVRLAAFEWLRQQVEVHGDVLPRCGRKRLPELLQQAHARWLERHLWEQDW